MRRTSALAALPLAAALVHDATRTPSEGATAAAAKSAKARSGKGKSAGKGTPKEFSVPIENLRAWANTVVVTLEGVRIEGTSRVHKIDDDCEMHFGGHTSAFQGDPDGLVLEPMNACVQPFPGKNEQNDADWNAFGRGLIDKTVTASGVPRIWPEHLSGGSASNPDHAVELHPLTTLVSGGMTFDFSKNVFSGEYRGGVGEETAEKIVQDTSVSVTKSGDNVDISFFGGRIGNFTTLDFTIDRDSIQSDGAGSFRMNGEVTVEDSVIPVRIVTVKGSPINDEMQRIRGRRRESVTMEALILFSLSPESLLEAANRSQGRPVTVERPLQLILYGPEDSE